MKRQNKILHKFSTILPAPTISRKSQTTTPPSLLLSRTYKKSLWFRDAGEFFYRQVLRILDSVTGCAFSVSSESSEQLASQTK